MPQKPTHPYWQARIRELAGGNPEYSSARIRDELELEAARLDSPPEPFPTSDRTVDRYRPKPESEEERRARDARWPESFPVDLPWDHSGSYFELFRYLQTNQRIRGGVRPSCRLVEWFHRVTLAAPDREVRARLADAVQLVASELGLSVRPGESGEHHDPVRDRRSVEASIADLPAPSSEPARLVLEDLAALKLGIIWTTLDQRGEIVLRQPGDSAESES